VNLPLSSEIAGTGVFSPLPTASTHSIARSASNRPASGSSARIASRIPFAAQISPPDRPDFFTAFRIAAFLGNNYRLH
jgi:hypothetical protein